MTKIFLHIGTEKTGTTSIQAYMHKNSDQLRNLNFIYPKAFGDNGHYDLTIYTAQKNKTIDLRSTGYAKKTSKQLIYDSFPDYFKHILIDEYESIGKTIILSNEHLSSRITTQEEIEKIKLLLETISNNISIIVYLRPHDKYLVSLYNTAVLCGHTYKLEDRIQQLQMDHLPYSKLLDLWSGVFGRENIHAMSYDKVISSQGLIENFKSICMIPESEYLNIKQRNTSYSKQFLEVLRIINSILASMNIKKTSRSAKIVRKLATFLPFGKEKIRLTDTQKAYIKLVYSKDIKLLNEIYHIEL